MGRNAETRAKYLEKNKTIIAEKKRAYYLANQEKLKQYQRDYGKNNIEHIRKHQKTKRDTNLMYKLKGNVKSLIGNSLRSKNFKKLTKTELILGCTYIEFKQHLESQFAEWMNWDNRGLYNGTKDYGWDIDHIIPLSSALTEADIIRLNHYTNLRPLCSHINRDIKRDLPI